MNQIAPGNDYLDPSHPEQAMDHFRVMVNREIMNSYTDDIIHKSNLAIIFLHVPESAPSEKCRKLLVQTVPEHQLIVIDATTIKNLNDGDPFSSFMGVPVHGIGEVFLVSNFELRKWQRLSDDYIQTIRLWLEAFNA